MMRTHPRELETFNADANAEDMEVDDSEHVRRGTERSSFEVSTEGIETPSANRVGPQMIKKKQTKTFKGDPQMADLLIGFMSNSFMPLSMVVEASFIRLVTFLSPGKTALPDREAMCRIVEHKAAKQRYETVQQVRKEVGSFSLSAEIWYSRLEKYIVLLCHHLSAAFEPATFPLGVINTGDEEVDDLVKVVLRECGLSMKNASLLLSSNDKVVCELAADLNVKRFPDIWAVVKSVHASWILLPRSELTGVIAGGNGNATDNQSERPRHVAQLNVARVISDLKHLADYFDNHWEVKKTLLRARMLGDEKDSEEMMIRKTNCNSWDEVYDFLAELMIWRPSINGFFASSPTSTSGWSVTEPTPTMWFVAEALLLLWRPLRDALQFTTTEKSRTLPSMIHWLVDIKQQFAQENALEGLATYYRLMATDISRDLLVLQKCILEAISKNYDSLLSELLWCSLLDPRYANMEHVSDDKRELCKTTLIEQAIELNRKASSSQEPMHTWLHEANDAEMEEKRMCVADEVSSYLAEHKKPEARITDPFMWWRDNGKRYLLLSALARVWLGTSGCSSADIGGLHREIPYQVYADNLKHEDTEDRWETMINMLYLHVSLREPMPLELHP